MAKEKLTFEDAKTIIVKNLPEDFFSGPDGDKHREALSLMGVAFERAKDSNVKALCNKVRKEFAERFIESLLIHEGDFAIVKPADVDNLVKEMEEK